MKRQEFFSHFEELMEVEPGTLTGATPLKDIKRWDSLATVAFMAMVHEATGTPPSPREIATGVTVEDLIRVVGPGIED